MQVEVLLDHRQCSFFAVYRQGLEELFETMPSVKGLVIRFHLLRCITRVL